MTITLNSHITEYVDTLVKREGAKKKGKAPLYGDDGATGRKRDVRRLHEDTGVSEQTINKARGRARMEEPSLKKVVEALGGRWDVILQLEAKDDG